MRIYSMTATFGKLEHETLTLEPGLNVLHKPNEWGKSTWCAFLIAMLYGLDTRAKSTKGSLADKERYAPWSGAPMAGRIDLNWNGRDITIERSTKGRIPLGQFRAYETASGLAVPELDGWYVYRMMPAWIVDTPIHDVLYLVMVASMVLAVLFWLAMWTLDSNRRESQDKLIKLA